MCGAPLALGTEVCANCGEVLVPIADTKPKVTVVDTLMALILVIVTGSVSGVATFSMMSSKNPTSLPIVLALDALLWGPTVVAFACRKSRFADRSIPLLLAQALLVSWCLLIGVPIAIIALLTLIRAFGR